MLKYLHIAVTVLSLTMCLSLIVLWVRTAFTQDIISGRIASSRTLIIGSLNGAVGVRLVNADPSEWAASRYPPDRPIPLPFRTFFGFGGLIRHQSDIFWIRVPYWFLVAVNAVVIITLLRGCRTNFSLRTLFIATTLIAIALGIIAAAK